MVLILSWTNLIQHFNERAVSQKWDYVCVWGEDAKLREMLRDIRL